MKILVLDDDQSRIDQFKDKLAIHDVTAVKTARDAIKEVRKGNWDYIFLDHDLADEHYENKSEALPGTGFEVAAFLHDHSELAPKNMVIIHSYNPIGAERMRKHLINLSCIVRKVPGIWTQKLV